MPYLSGVHTAVALSDYPPQSWDVKLPRTGFVLDTGASARRRRRLGRCGCGRTAPARPSSARFGSLFTNRALGLADNARLLGNIVGASVAPGGAVLFDDEHQGLGLAYDPAKFYRDPRLYATLGVLGAVWLTWVLGGTQLRLGSVRARAPREAELVRATGLFLARVLRPAAAARRMFEYFFRALRAPRAQRRRRGRRGSGWSSTRASGPPTCSSSRNGTPRHTRTSACRWRACITSSSAPKGGSAA